MAVKITKAKAAEAAPVAAAKAAATKRTVQEIIEAAKLAQNHEEHDALMREYARIVPDPYPLVSYDMQFHGVNSLYIYAYPCRVNPNFNNANVNYYDGPALGAFGVNQRGIGIAGFTDIVDQRFEQQEQAIHRSMAQYKAQIKVWEAQLKNYKKLKALVLAEAKTMEVKAVSNRRSRNGSYTQKLIQI